MISTTGKCHHCGAPNPFSVSACTSCSKHLPWAAYLAYLSGSTTLKEQGVSERKIHRLTEKLIDGVIAPSDWKAEVKPMAFKLHVSQTALTRKRHLTALSWHQMHSNILFVFATIDEFEARFSAGPDRIRKLRENSEGNNPFEAETWARLGVGRCTSQNIEIWMRAEEGHAQARRQASHPICGKDCRAEIKKGWVPIPQFTPFGRFKPWNDCWCLLETE